VSFGEWGKMMESGEKWRKGVCRVLKLGKMMESGG